MRERERERTMRYWLMVMPILVALVVVGLWAWFVLEIGGVL